MKKVFFLIISITVFWGNDLLAQQHDIFGQQKDTYSVQPYQAGTISFNGNGTVQVLLEDGIKEMLSDSRLQASYYVIFTPVDDLALAYVSNKTNLGFAAVMKSIPGITKESKVDYVVFVKKKLQQVSLNKAGSAPIQQ